MHLFKGGRAPLLDFLRNLTPQAVLLSFVLVIGSKLEPTCCFPENASNTIIFLSFLAILLAAIWSNSSLFVENYLISVKRIERASKLLKRLGVTGIINLWAILKYAWRFQRIVFVEVVVVFIVLEFGIVTVLISALNAATTLLKNI